MNQGKPRGIVPFREAAKKDVTTLGRGVFPHTKPMNSFIFRISLASIFVVTAVKAEELVPEVDFNRDIRPILSDKCFHCHGPDAKNQRSEFRIDTFEHATEDLDGVQGIVPGKPEESEVSFRIHLPNDDIDVMPPLDSNRVLTRREKELLDAWIKKGADYDEHWSFKKPVRPELPKVSDANQKQTSNPIDHFLVSRLEEEKLQPSDPADLQTRLRRAALTLTGLPPTIEMVEQALADPPEKAYEKFVDRLLASDHYAERQTLRWLDAARYADTDGYQNDAERKNWPWRDWVIQAYRDNMPFDQFTIEQLAGDLLPDATELQILGSAFNRNHRQNSEGGALAPEFFIENVIDRVETTSTVWLGLTMGCARCHDHKYDPLSQQEFFQLFAYFNNIGERGIGQGVNANPVMKFRSPLVDPPVEITQALDQAEAAEAEAKRTFSKRFREWLSEVENDSISESDLSSWVAHPDLTKAEVTNALGELTRERDGSWLFGGQNVAKPVYELELLPGNGKTIAAVRVDAMPHPEFGKPRKLARSTNGNFVLTDIKLTAAGKPLPIARATASFEQDDYPISNAIDGEESKTGWAVNDTKPSTVSAFFILEKPVQLKKDESLGVRMAFMSRFGNHNMGRFKIYTSGSDFTSNTSKAKLPPKVTKALKTPSKRRSGAERKVLSDFYRTIDRPQKEASRAIKKLEAELAKLGAESVPVMVMREREGERVPAYLLDRGAYDAPDRSKELPRAVPAAFFDGDDEDQPGDRLELARWIVSPRNPLTARVIVNRIWQDHFGVGLVKTSEDFGSQSELPSHPELLDWLSVEFMESGWDVKALHKLIVTSAAFQQSSVVTKAQHDRDPENRLLARGPRYRLDGFVIRDLALQASGLLNDRLGGAPVKPYQPEGLWNSVAGRSNIRYALSKGEDLYRKSLYTYWKRAVNPPRQLIFDAGGREACNVAVRRTNTPLQALVLMNDVTFLEAARHLAETVIKEEPDRDKRLALIYRRVTALDSDQRKVGILKENLDFFTRHFAEKPEAATEFLAAGESPRDESIPAGEHAAWTAVAHLVLNLDTSISLQ